MESIRSKDGTTIAFDRTGHGLALVMVMGAFCNRFSTTDLAGAMDAGFTVYAYDRRGRGDSGDTGEYAIEREVDDLAAITAVAAEAGDVPFVYGHSSGAALALEAASRGVAMQKLAVYEPPYTDDDGPTSSFADELRELVAAGRRNEAAERFLTLTGAPVEMIEQIKASAYWPNMQALAHTLPYDIALCNGGSAPVERFARIDVPTLALAGRASPTWAAEAARVIASVVPGGKYRVLDGQDHNVADEAIASVLTDFFV